MAKKPKKLALDSTLVKSVKDLLKEVMEKPAEGAEPKYSLTDKMKVIDRVIDIEKIRLDIAEDDDGAFFKDRGKHDEHE